MKNFRFARNGLPPGGHQGLRHGRLLRSQTELLGDQFIRPAPVPMIVSDGPDHHFIRLIQAGDIFNALTDGLRRPNDRSAGTGGCGSIPAILRQKLQCLIRQDLRATALRFQAGMLTLCLLRGKSQAYPG